MLCPRCKSLESRVVDSRLVEEGACIRRRRVCQSCSWRFTTYERYDGLPLMVIKKDKRREPFDRKKLKLGIIKACNKRRIQPETIEKMVDTIEERIRKVSTSEISSDQVGYFVLEQLRNVDEVAYIRFISVFREFNEASSFIKQAQELESSELIKN